MRRRDVEIALLVLPGLIVIGLDPWLAWPRPAGLTLAVIAGMAPALYLLRQSRAARAADSHRAQARQSETWAFIQRILDVIPEAVYLKSQDGRYTLVNTAFEQEKGRARAELLGRTVQELYPGSAGAERSHAEDRAVLAGQFIRKEEDHVHPVSGRPVTRIIIKGHCLDPDGQPVLVGIHIDITSLRQSETQLRSALARQAQHNAATNAFVQRVLDLIPYPVYVKDAQSRYLLVNEALAQDKHTSREELLGHLGISERASPEVMFKHFDEDGRVLAGEKIFKEEHKNHFHTGQEVFRIISKGCCLDAQGEPVIVGVHFSITELRQAERAMQQALERETALRKQVQEFLQRLIDVIPDPFYIKKAGGRYVMVNEAFAASWRLDKALIVSDTWQDKPEVTGSPTYQTSLDEDRRVLAGEEILKEEHVTRRATGTEIYRVVCKRPSVFFDGEPVVIGIDHNITRWKVAERELQRLAQEDALTGLANRRYFSLEAERAIDRAERYGEVLGLIMLDIDHFKRINDAHGHQAGDQALVEAVRCMTAILRKSDLAGRWGGEEFIVLLPHTSAEEGLQVAKRLCDALAANPVQITPELTLSLSFSAGFALRHAGEQLDALIGRADAALYQAKNRGRNQVVTAAPDGEAPT